MRITKPNRVTRTYTQRPCRRAVESIPLAVPVREADWLDGWDPLVVLKSIGAAEPDCVFSQRPAQARPFVYHQT